MRTITASFLLLAALTVTSACHTNSAALNASVSNKLWIGQVQIGQTMDEVRHIMHKGPESQNVATLPDGTTETVWNYVTDYGNDTNTSITFRGNRVAAINQTPWLGNGDFSQPSKSH
jgi:hypothetical protein